MKLKEEANYEGSAKLIFPRPAMSATPSVKPQKRKDGALKKREGGEKSSLHVVSLVREHWVRCS